MKKFAFLFSILIFSCNKDIASSNADALRNDVFASQEFAEMRISYDEYDTFKFEQIQNILNQKNAGKLSSDAFENMKEEYINKCADLFLKVVEKQSLINKKYPNFKEIFSSNELLEEVINKQN